MLVPSRDARRRRYHTYDINDVNRIVVVDCIGLYLRSSYRKFGCYRNAAVTVPLICTHTPEFCVILVPPRDANCKFGQNRNAKNRLPLLYQYKYCILAPFTPSYCGRSHNIGMPKNADFVVYCTPTTVLCALLIVNLIVIVMPPLPYLQYQ